MYCIIQLYLFEQILGAKPGNDTHEECRPSCRLGQCCIDGKCLCIDSEAMKVDDCECAFK